MSIVKVEKNNYTVEPLYQWDVNQQLKIYGLSLAAVPEIHFTSEAMSRAIVRSASMDAAGVVTTDVPNSLLQKPYKVIVYVCYRTGDTFETLYKIEVPVKARPQPQEYELIDDQEVYSFEALEYEIKSMRRELDTKVSTMEKQVSDAIKAGEEAKVAGAEAKAAGAAAVQASEEVSAQFEATATDLLYKTCQTVNGCGGSDGSEFVVLTPDGVRFGAGWETLTIDFNLHALPNEAYICYIGDLTFNDLDNEGNLAYFNAVAYALINDVRVEVATIESDLQSQSIIVYARRLGEWMSELGFNLVQIYGRPLTKADSFKLVFEATKVGGDSGNIEFSSVAANVRYIGG